MFFTVGSCICRITPLDRTKSTNKCSQSISKSLLLVRLQSSKQALMSLCEAFCQVCSCILSFIAQRESEHTTIMKITHPLHPSLLLQIFYQATHRTFLEIQAFSQRLLRQRRSGCQHHKREHFRD